MTPPMRVVPPDEIPDPRSQEGTPLDRRTRLPFAVKFRYTLVLVIAIVAAGYAGGTRGTASDAKHAATEAKHAAHQAQRVSADVAQLVLRVARDEHATTSNRVHNVSTWCNAINAGYAALDAYVTAAQAAHPTTNLPPLGLRSLPCTRLEHATQASETSR